MAERFGPQRLRALAKVEGLHDDGKPAVLVLFTHNAGRSQMAMGFFEAITGTGPSPGLVAPNLGREINPSAIPAMAERYVGQSPVNFLSRGPTKPSERLTLVITMGCGDGFPIFPGKRLSSPGTTCLTRRALTRRRCNPSVTISSSMYGISSMNSASTPMPSSTNPFS